MAALTSSESIEAMASLFETVFTLMLEFVRRLTSAPHPDQMIDSAVSSLLIK